MGALCHDEPPSKETSAPTLTPDVTSDTPAETVPVETIQPFDPFVPDSEGVITGGTVSTLTDFEPLAALPATS